MHHEKTTGEDNDLLILRFAAADSVIANSPGRQGGLDLRNEIHGSESIFTECNPLNTITSFSTKIRRLCDRKSRHRFRMDSRPSEEAIRIRYPR